MKKMLKFMAVIAVFGASMWAFMSIPETRRMADRVMLPDPVEHRKAAWAELASRGLEPGMPVFIRIFKDTSELEVWMQSTKGWELFRTIEICKWSGLPGPKLKEGDRQAPEGFYWVSKGRMNPNSSHHLSFNLGFPNKYDRSHGRTGSFLMVHGGCSSIGCYAIRDHEVEVVYRLVDAALTKGQKKVAVHAFPFRMTRAALNTRKGHKWHGFWKMLKPGYDTFERERRVPRIRVANKSYVVN